MTVESLCLETNVHPALDRIEGSILTAAVKVLTLI